MASIEALIRILSGQPVQKGFGIRDVLKDIAGTAQGVTAVRGAIQGEEAAGEASDLRRAATRGIDQQTRIARDLDRTSAPLREEGVGFLKDVLQGKRPPLLKRITGPATGQLARQFSGARDAISSRVNRGGARQRLLSNSFLDEARARTDLESGFASNALNQALGIGFKVPINSANIFGSAAGNQTTLAQQQTQRARQGGAALDRLFDVFGSP